MSSLTICENCGVAFAAHDERSWERARTATELLPFPNFYVHCPSRTDPSAASGDRDSIMVLLPVANMQESGTGDPSQSGFQVLIMFMLA